MQRLFDLIDLINKRAYDGVSLLFVPMTLISMYEVVMRYIFNNPTTWVWDVNVQCFCAIVVLGGAHTLQQGGHVIMDIIINKLSERTRLIVNIAVYIVFFFAMSIAVWQIGNFALRSIRLFEKASTIFSPPVYPIKTGIFIGVTLLVLQAIPFFVRDILALKALSKERRGA